MWFPIAAPELGTRAVADAVLDNRFAFHGEEFELSPGFDWRRNPSRDAQWLILFHKFYHAPALGAAWREAGDGRYLAKWIELTGSWLEQIPVDLFPADVAGRRIQNWISAYHRTLELLALFLAAVVFPEDPATGGLLDFPPRNHGKRTCGFPRGWRAL